MISKNFFSIGLFYTLNQYFNLMIQKLNLINQEKINISSLMPSFEKVNKYMSFKNVKHIKGDFSNKEDFRNRAIHLCNISFSYGEIAVLNQLSCSILPGKFTVIVGENGEGKSTLLALLMRFYIPNDGYINVGSQNINTISTLALRMQIGYIQQDSTIFTGTLRENMQLFNPNCTEKDIWDALEICKIKSTVETWENKLDTNLNCGDCLSGGEIQRIALSRIVVKKPSIVLMDEPTAALDTVTELQLLHDIKNIFKDKLVLVISHRIEVAKLSDHTLVMKDGKIIAEGEHHLLKNTCDHYAALFAL